MNETEAKRKIADAGGLLQGEFFFALKDRGRVATQYVNMDPVFTRPQLIDMLGAELIVGNRLRSAVIAAPAVGGIPLAYAAARFSQMYSVRVVWADKQKDGSFAFERMSFGSVVKGRAVLIVEDIATTGKSAKAVGDLVQAAGGNVLGYSFIWNRGGVDASTMHAPVQSIINERIPSYVAEAHEKWGVWPLVEDIGHPEYFPDYPGPRITLLK